MHSLVHGNFVYFFFRETAVEYINCGKVGTFMGMFVNNLKFAFRACTLDTTRVFFWTAVLGSVLI